VRAWADKNYKIFTQEGYRSETLTCIENTRGTDIKALNGELAKRDMVISGGVNIYPAEIEASLAAMPGVHDCAVFGIPDPEFGEALAVAIQQEPGANLDANAVRVWLAARIADYKVPRVVEFHAALPREESGKIFKRRLREPYWTDAGRRI